MKKLLLLKTTSKILLNRFSFSKSFYFFHSLFHEKVFRSEKVFSQTHSNETDSELNQEKIQFKKKKELKDEIQKIQKDLLKQFIKKNYFFFLKSFIKLFWRVLLMYQEYFLFLFLFLAI